MILSSLLLSIQSLFALSETPAIICSPPVTQVLLYKWKAEATANEKSSFLELFKNLPAAVDGVESVTIKKLLLSREGFEVMISISFSSGEGISQYQNHPVHDEIIDSASRTTAEYTFLRY